MSAQTYAVQDEKKNQTLEKATTAVTTADSTTSHLLPSSVSFSATYYDGYIATRISRLLTPDPSIWYQASLKWQSGLYFNWLEIHGVNETDWSSGPADETQVTLGYSWRVGKFDVKTETTLINIHPIEKWFDHDRYSFDLYVSRTYNFKWNGAHTVTPELRTIWFTDTQSIEKGVPIVMPSILHKWSNPFEVSCLAIQTKLALAWDGGLYKNDSDGVFLQLDTGFQWKFGKATITLPGFKLLSPLSKVNDGRDKNHSLFYGGIKYEF